jgi:hypothetical protein
MSIAEQRISDLDRLVMPLVRDIMMTAKTTQEKSKAMARVNQALDERLVFMRERDAERAKGGGK